MINEFIYGVGTVGLLVLAVVGMLYVTVLVGWLIKKIPIEIRRVATVVFVIGFLLFVIFCMAQVVFHRVVI